MAAATLTALTLLVLSAMPHPSTAYPDIWLSSPINKDKSCIVPIGFKPGGRMMETERVLDAENGSKCSIQFDADRITVFSDVPAPEEIGFIIEVSEGTVRPRFKDHAGFEGDTCAYGAGDSERGFVRFDYILPENPSGEPITASATCGTYIEADMYTTVGVERLS